MRSATICGVSIVMSARSITPRMMVFDGNSFSTLRSSLGCAASMEICCALRAFQFRQERIARRFVVHHGGIAEAQMHRDRAGDAVERAVERLEPVLPGLVGMLLHPRLVDLHHVGAGGEQILDLGIDRRGISQRHRFFVFVVVVLRLLAHGERTGQRRLDGAVRYWRAEIRDRAARSGALRRIGPTTRGTGIGRPLRLMTVPGLSMSMPSSAVAKRLE